MTFGGINVMFYQCVSVLIVISITNWYVIAVFPFMFLGSYCLFSYSIAAYRETSRIESITRSPLLNLLSETFNGCSTIRAFDKEDEFIEKNYELLNKNVLANQVNMGCWCWYGVRMSLLTVVMMASTTSVCMVFRF
jgi:ABC-type bacteriocin/lantibiotic exporter with double-glycine peptidase domain